MCDCPEEAQPKAVDPAVTGALDYLMEMHKIIHTKDRSRTLPGHWINEAFVVRLCAVPDAHDVVNGLKPIDTSLDGHKEVDICRRLRNVIAHQTGEINSKKSRKTDQMMRQVFGLGDEPSMFPKKFRLDKDRVLRPMWKGCKRYCLALLEKERGLSTISG